jgi:hypothetical protein
MTQTVEAVVAAVAAVAESAIVAESAVAVPASGGPCVAGLLSAQATNKYNRAAQ